MLLAQGMEAATAPLRDGPAAGRRVLVDDRARSVVSDRIVYSPHYPLNPGLRA